MALTDSNKKHIHLLVVSSLIFLFSVSPVSAQPTTTNASTYAARKKIPIPNLLRFSQKVAGCCTGFVVGTPICFAKKLTSETDYGAHEIVGGLSGNNNNKVLIVPVTIMWLPAATLTSAVEAPFYSFKHATSADRPFSKEQFSLHDFDVSRE